MIILELIFQFCKAGLFTVGGALAAIPLLKEMSDSTSWFTLSQLADMLAISESTPGPIGINMATYVGFTVSGIPGGIIASISFVLPSTCIALIVAKLLKQFGENKQVKAAFYGLRPASLALISAAGLSVCKLSLLRSDLYNTTGNFLDLFYIKAIILAVVLFFLTGRVKLHPIIFIAGSAVVGIILKLK